jgi:hypothetical protein
MSNLRTTLVLGIFAVAMSSAVSQIVNFNNSILVKRGPPDRLVYMPDMVTGVV